MDIQTDAYLEELTDTVPEVDTQTQTDAFLDRPPTPLFIPQKTGVDAVTQIENGERARGGWRTRGAWSQARTPYCRACCSGGAHSLVAWSCVSAAQATCLTLTLRWNPSSRCWWARCWSRA